MSAIGLIFSNIHDNNIPELTAKRTVASIPFGGRYRLIDFALSNMVNSEITKVGVITKSNYRSLMDHVGSGKDWDLARHHGGLFILPPFEGQNGSLYTTRLEALKNVAGFLSKSTEEFVVMSDSDMVCNVNFKSVIKEHTENKADITLICVDKKRSEAIDGSSSFITTDENGKVIDVAFDSKDENVCLYTNMCVIGRTTLLNLISEALSHGNSHFIRDLIIPHVATGKVYACKHSGYYAEMTSLQKYYEENMRVLDRSFREELFKQSAVYTKVKDSVPARYGDNAVAKNSIIADGCVIEGEVYDSVLFRGVKIGRGTVVRNCVLMQNTITGENVSMNCIITDKNVVVRDGRTLSGCDTHPFFISKGSVI